MQTILGANGQIAEELAKKLYKNYTKTIRLVSRNPKKIHETDQLFPADLMDADATYKAVEGSNIVYLTVGLPMNSTLWEEQFPVMMKNTINACKHHKVKLVFFDNTYMYAKTSEPQTEESPFKPLGRKSKVRAQLAEMLLKEMEAKTIEAVICRAPEFYGPNKTQSITNSLLFDAITQDKKIKIPLSDKTKRSLIWTPDASRAMALIGNTPDAYCQTWHLPCDDNRYNYKELVSETLKIYGQLNPNAPVKNTYSIIKMWQFKLGSLFSKPINELMELLPRYKYDNIFVSDKFKSKFPSFNITSMQEGITQILNEKKQ